MILYLPFTTLFQYLQLLEEVVSRFPPLGKRGVAYLAGAVSDFYVPWPSLGEHKIQSSGGPLAMQLAQVPKMIPILRTKWAPKAFVVSFKLETDWQLLISKAKGALERYGIHAVVANELLSRKERVDIVTSGGEVTTVHRETYKDVEEPLIAFLVSRHDDYIREV